MVENIRLSFQGIWSHKMRSFLTMLGVIIGIASIIAIVSTIEGTNEQIMQNLIGAGNNNVKITLRQGEGEYWMDNGAPAGVSLISQMCIRDRFYAICAGDASERRGRPADGSHDDIIHQLQAYVLWAVICGIL